ncbi:hypothetical protein [Ureaplasma zalophigenitalium]|uniref:Uncharacterized protein n=1 Tax=Ureaplasma zalophigenitalium TaxID=907723 RepID=A0ABT3BQ11_9BACT|nr:hypothetical protein [Ureaplasma zalophigenitalium]MCV3754345.1 hypothetical protein [Ureaplasma zalophigenitalium]
MLKTMYKYQGNDEFLKLIEPKPSKTIKKIVFFLKNNILSGWIDLSIK